MHFVLNPSTHAEQGKFDDRLYVWIEKHQTVMPVEIECLLSSTNGEVFLKKVLAMLSKAINMGSTKDFKKSLVEMVTAGSEVRAIFERGFKDVMCRMYVDRKGWRDGAKMEGPN